jgi:hypothetical protein
MTWWAAVLGFVGALAGSWGGQLIAARREDRRWERERDREEVRWQRELQRIHEQKKHELQLDWRDRKLAAFTEYITELDQVFSFERNAKSVVVKVGVAFTATTVLDSTEADKLSDLLSNSCSRMSKTLEPLRIIGDASTVDQCKKINSELFSISLKVRYADGPLDIGIVFGPLFRARDNLLTCMRNSLGVDSLVPANQPQPSAMTS